MTWQVSPAATELEEVVLDWLRTLLGLPCAFEGWCTTPRRWRRCTRSQRRAS
jgi:glutamate/tyrosine decarboxylase-like PLP-dependent enzyme